ncbi:porin [Caulobacter segnis]|uniref:porin n=1 Tax=Caulobacter segnis TaxID=88688 RepID=UPI00240EA32B|nr:porin [Caulobacter segnis]MDG2519996.1 porin [Caulobacter segnis]
MIGSAASLACLFAMPAAAAAQAAMTPAEEAAALRSEVEALKARLEAMEARLEALSAPAPSPAAPTPSAPPAPVQTAAKAEDDLKITWKGSPRFSQDGMTFKAKGRLQFDAGWVGRPDWPDQSLGYANEARRIRLGGEGSLSKDFGYKLELEFSDNGVDLVDTFVTWNVAGWLLTLGNQNPFQSLDELTGDTTGSFMERAAFTDAFAFERRLGLSGQRRSGDWLLQAGVFSDDIDSLSSDGEDSPAGDENDSIGLDGRVVYSPRVGDSQIHLAASAHWRDRRRLDSETVRYRQRPYLHVTDTRLISAGPLRVDEEFTHGVEAALITGPWHAVAEGHWLNADRFDDPDARFFGGYLEIGRFLTPGDTRAYKNGIFDRSTPVRPWGEGGWGSLQASLRYDYLDLDSGAIRGGRQHAGLAALIWTPVDNLRFNLNYGLIHYEGASPLLDGRRDYNVHVGGARVELDF